MNRNSNLQKSLKKAFEEHKEPLHEAQWDRLNAALGDKKPKRKLFPWLFGLIVIVGFSVSLGYWMGNTSDHNTKLAEQSLVDGLKDVKSHSSDAPTTNSTEQVETPDKNDKTILNAQTDYLEKKNGEINKKMDDNSGNLNHEVFSNEIHPNSGKENNQVKRSSQYGISKGMRMTNNGNQLSGNANNVNSNLNANLENIGVVVDHQSNENTLSEQTDLSRRSLVKSPNPTIYKKEELALIEMSEVKTVVKPKALAKDVSNVINESRFAIGLSTGVSNAVYQRAEFSAASHMHYDTRMVYDQGNQNVKSSFANLFFDVKVLKNINLTFYSGVQYRQLQSSEDINYKHNNLPFRYPDGSISGYLFVADSANPEIFHNVSTHTTRFMAVPLTLGYTFPVGTRNEIQVNGGVILNKMVSAKGSSFSLNDAQIVDIGQKYSKKVTFGYIGGLNYYRQLYKPLWLGVGVQMQQNKTTFETDYGTINSHIKITNYSLNIKYKF